MSFTINPENPNNESVGPFSYKEHPDTCPICFRHIEPKQRISSVSRTPDSKMRLQIIYRCANKSCDSFFIATYYQKESTANSFSLQDLSPKGYLKEECGEIIEKLSPKFVKIYNQALAAETIELEQIAGMGLRKALEFLIKDFAIHQNPNDHEKIKATPLGTVINNYVNDINLKTTAERAVWLGNDETHYVREWIDKDINDLKILIQMSKNWIEIILLTEQYSSDMPKKPKAKN